MRNEEGADPCRINQNATLSLRWFEKNTSFAYTLNPVNKAGYIFVLSSDLMVENTKIGQRHAIGIWDTDNINFQIEQEAAFIVIEVPVNH